ncbi:unnamed protein product [Thlaspi arvense]|uniref:Bet v I/Major latex protein domain-containing protein n=1 Tax=Thlaspi arvense TaxID=13288 RepID=A0AAU9R8Z9_THLAR|nr:unnamed protein product [Thlaspi arvense]
MVEEEVEVDVEIQSPADKFHMFARSQHVSKATRFIQGCDVLEGEWEKAGSIVIWKLIFDGEPRVSKDKIETLDSEKNVIQWRVLEGHLKKVFKSFLKTMTVCPKQGGPGSVVKWNVKYERIDDEKVAQLETQLQFFVEMTKEVDQYLLSQQ